MTKSAKKKNVQGSNLRKAVEIAQRSAKLADKEKAKRMELSKMRREDQKRMKKLQAEARAQRTEIANLTHSLAALNHSTPAVNTQHVNTSDVGSSEDVGSVREEGSEEVEEGSGNDEVRSVGEEDASDVDADEEWSEQAAQPKAITPYAERDEGPGNGPPRDVTGTSASTLHDRGVPFGTPFGQPGCSVGLSPRGSNVDKDGAKGTSDGGLQNLASPAPPRSMRRMGSASQHSLSFVGGSDPYLPNYSGSQRDDGVRRRVDLGTLSSSRSKKSARCTASEDGVREEGEREDSGEDLNEPELDADALLWLQLQKQWKVLSREAMKMKDGSDKATKLLQLAEMSDRMEKLKTVSYTHLTLPTKRIV